MILKLEFSMRVSLICKLILIASFDDVHFVMAQLSVVSIHLFVVVY